MNFKGKVVLVTGSSRGIGRSIAVKFAKEGASVIINYKSNENEAKAITEIISSYVSDCMCIQADVSKEHDVKRMIDTIIEKYGHIDILVNNAGIAIDNDFQNRHVKDWQETLNTNLIGVFLTSKYAGKYMLENQYGKIINISSTNGIDTNEAFSIDYDASKAGLISLTNNFAKALGPYVNVNAVCPGWTKTDPTMEMNPTYIESEIEKIALKRFAEPEEVADAVLFLASDEAKYINGTTIRVDGGL